MCIDKPQLTENAYIKPIVSCYVEGKEWTFLYQTVNILFKKELPQASQNVFQRSLMRSLQDGFSGHYNVSVVNKGPHRQILFTQFPFAERSLNCLSSAPPSSSTHLNK